MAAKSSASSGLSAIVSKLGRICEPVIGRMVKKEKEIGHNDHDAAQGSNHRCSHDYLAECSGQLSISSIQKFNPTIIL
jgi:hypothetical protein